VVSNGVKSIVALSNDGVMGVGSGSRGALWIFIHGTDIVDRGLIVLLFVYFFAIFRSFFPVDPFPWKRLNSAIFQYFFVAPSLKIFLPTPLGGGRIELFISANNNN